MNIDNLPPINSNVTSSNLGNITSIPGRIQKWAGYFFSMPSLKRDAPNLTHFKQTLLSSGIEHIPRNGMSFKDFLISIKDNPLLIKTFEGALTLYHLSSLAGYKEARLALDERRVTALSLKGRAFKRAMKQIDKEENTLKLDSAATMALLTSITKFALPTLKSAFVDPLVYLSSGLIGSLKDRAVIKKQATGTTSYITIAANALGSVAACFNLLKLSAVIQEDDVLAQGLNHAYSVAFALKLVETVAKKILPSS